MSWKSKPLKDLCTDYKSAIVDGPFGSNLKREHYTTEGVPVLKIQNVKSYQINNKKLDYVTSEKAAELKRHAYTKGDIVMTKLGNPLGASAIVEDLNDGIIVADLVRIRADLVNTKFLCYQLNSPDVQYAINKQQKGATRPRVKISMVRDLQINVPNDTEQKRIVVILDEAFAGIDKAIANTEKNLASARELFESTLINIFSQESEKTPLGKVCDVIGGGTPSKSNDRFYNGDIPWATVRDMRSDILKNTEHKITQDAVKQSSTNIIPKENVVIATRVGLGKICFLNQDTAINQDLRGVLPIDKNKIDVRYLFWWFKSVSNLIIKAGTGATVQGVKLPFVKELKIPILTIKEQKDIVSQLDLLQHKVENIETIYRKKLASLNELKQSLLQKAFSGELTKDIADEVQAEAAA